MILSKKKRNPFSNIYIDDDLGSKSKRRYQKRRENLKNMCPFPVCILGLKEEYKTHFLTIKTSNFVQDPLFFYLTGINQSNIALFLNNEKDEEILFLPKKDLKKDFWEGYQFGIGDKQQEAYFKKILGFKKYLPIETLIFFLKERLMMVKKKKQLGLFWHQSKKIMIKDHYYEFYEEIKSFFKKHQVFSNEIFINIQNVVWKLRPNLDLVDVTNLKKACQISMDVFKSLLKNHKKFNNEKEISGFIEGEIKKQSSFGLSFSTIVASGENATTLHYTKNDDPIDLKKLILIDFGAKWYLMNADITRTIPANGKFNPLQRLLYEIVLEAQRRVENQAKAGVSIDVLNEICWDFINDALEEQIKQKKGKVTLKYDKVPHGVSHLIGIEVHDGDPFGNYKSVPMQEGWVISNEAGVYGEFELSIAGKKYKESIGIRIEDNLLITKKSCVNLTKSCPKTIEEIESLMINFY